MIVSKAPEQTGKINIDDLPNQRKSLTTAIVFVVSFIAIYSAESATLVACGWLR